MVNGMAEPRQNPGHPDLPRLPCASSQHDGTPAIEEHAPLQVAADRIRQRAPVAIAPAGGRLSGRRPMIDALDSLLDDRPFIKLFGDEVRGCTNQFDAALVGLSVRPRALEAG